MFRLLLLAMLCRDTCGRLSCVIMSWVMSSDIPLTLPLWIRMVTDNGWQIRSFLLVSGKTGQCKDISLGLRCNLEADYLQCWDRFISSHRIQMTGFRTTQTEFHWRHELSASVGDVLVLGSNQGEISHLTISLTHSLSLVQCNEMVDNC